jgi:site-specific DNA recombinase
MDRPALQDLLKDIEAGKVDVVVVYKIDRLTRSLMDFAKIVEVFDAHEVVAVDRIEFAEIGAAGGLGGQR